MYYATLSFYANGGSGAPSSITNSSSTSTVVFTIPYTTPTRSGYTFAGWELTYTGGSSVYQPGGTARVEGTTGGITYTLYAIWEKVYTYYATLSFNANGGYGAPSSMTGYNTGSSTITFTIPYTTPTRSGYTFQGWQVTYTGGSTIYQPGSIASVEGTTSGITYTLYAVWEEIPTYYATLSFNANGGSGAPSSITNYTVGSSTVVFTIPSTVPIRTNYTFAGWQVTYTGGSTVYQPGDTARMEGTTGGITYTLYAVWEEIPTYYATLSFDANGGTGAPSNITNSTVGSSTVVFTIPYTTPTKTGYTFVGWEVTYTGGSAIYQPGSTASVEGTKSGITYTLVAVWLESGGGVHIYASGWNSASAYIYINGWQKATPYVWADGWKKGV